MSRSGDIPANPDAAAGLADAMASASGKFIAAAAERIASRGRQERLWFESWQEDYIAATTSGDDDSAELLVDVLVAFDAFQGEKRPTRLRRVA